MTAGLVPGLACRQEAVRLLRLVLLGRQPLDASFEASVSTGLLAGLEPRDRALTHAIVSLSLRRLGEIEARLKALVAKPLPRSSGSAREILLTSAAQILFMRVPPHAAIDLAVRAARGDRDAAHFAGLINAVLRRLAASPAEPADDPNNVPPWLWRRWTEAYGTQARQVAKSHLDEPPIDLSVKAEPERWAERLRAIRLPTGTLRLQEPVGPIDRLPGFQDGAWWVQDAAAALPARLLGEVAGRRVLDLCAAPGGKTAQMAAAGADVTAVDRSPQRLRRLQANLNRLGLSPTVVEADALDYAPPTPFYAVLLDAPCSATGTIRRHPDVPYIKRDSDIAAIASVQRELLIHAAQLVGKDGILVYSTCSLEPEEGEVQAERFLEHHPDFVREPIRPEEIGGLAHLITPAGDLRTLPFHEIGESRGLDGFYAARFRRR